MNMISREQWKLNYTAGDAVIIKNILYLVKPVDGGVPLLLPVIIQRGPFTVKATGGSLGLLPWAIFDGEDTVAHARSEKEAKILADALTDHYGAEVRG